MFNIEKQIEIVTRFLETAVPLSNLSYHKHSPEICFCLDLGKGK